MSKAFSPPTDDVLASVRRASLREKIRALGMHFARA
jgi:hypothetical protein